METPDAGLLKSEQILDELKRRQRSREVIAVEEERIKVVIFSSAGKRYAFYGSEIREILSSYEISWVPCLPSYIPGLINLRGEIESVIDIRHFLGEEKSGTAGSLIAMAANGEFQSGILIDAIEDVIDIPASALHPPLATFNGAGRELVGGEIVVDGETIPLLAVGKLARLITL